MKRIISEDNAMMNSQRDMQGMKNDNPPQANPMQTFLNANKKDNNYTASGAKPYPLDKADNILSDMMISIMNMDKILQNSLANPIVQKNYKDVVEKLIAKNKEITKTIVEISNAVDKIV